MNKSAQSGIAMVIVIWVISLMTIMAGSFALTMRRETTVVSAVKDNAQILAVAESGVTIAQTMLTLDDVNQRWQADGSIYQLLVEDAEIRVRLFSEQGKIDINQADEQLLNTLMNATSADLDTQQAIVSAILDWRDEDELIHTNGAEKAEYEEAGLSYHPANQEFQSLDELQMVLGMNATYFQEIQPLVTIYTGLPDVNLQTASKEVLQSIGNIDAALLEEYLLQRVENARAKLPPPAFPISSDGEGNKTSNKNEVYTVISEALLNGEMNAGIEVTIRKTANSKQSSQFQILDWQQSYQPLSLFNDEMEQFLVTEHNESE